MPLLCASQHVEVLIMQDVLAQMRQIQTALRERQLPNGALLSDPVSVSHENWLMPYYANLAAIGWMRAVAFTRHRQDYPRIRRWLLWYTQHMNSDGTIYDYTYHNGTLSSRNEYDSSDSYAATYLETLDYYVQATGETRFAADVFTRGVQRAVSAILMTYQPDGLTFARPDYPVKYLMDNVEVYRGLKAAARIAQRLRRYSEADSWKQRAQRTHQAIGNALWLPGREYYAWAKHADGAMETRLSEWYPDVMAQLMAIAWLPRSPRHETLYATLKTQFYTLPPTLHDNAAIERALWWGMAAHTLRDSATLNDIRTKLLRVDLRRRNLYPLSLYGHMARVLAD
ncbi:MAG: hypothetical protein NZ556_03675 [Fimbriimonadales bacterium]|nr:hypothetical protein [Fimbriimonadales bacterium]